MLHRQIRADKMLNCLEQYLNLQELLSHENKNTVDLDEKPGLLSIAVSILWMRQIQQTNRKAEPCRSSGPINDLLQRNIYEKLTCSADSHSPKSDQARDFALL